MGAPTTLYTMVDLSTVWVEIAVEEADIRHVHRGQKVQINVDAFPDETYWGEIISLAAQMEESSRTLAALVSLPNPKLALRPGMLARVKVELNTSKANGGMIIPRSAVLWTGKRSVVFVKKETHGTPVYQLREIQVGNTKGDDVDVLEGLMEGEEIVTNGVFTLDAAAQLQGAPSMMNRHPRKL